jgi:hypothetical protein
MNYIDTETGPLSQAELLRVMPEFTAPKNYVAPEKIAANIVAQRLEWMERAALDPLSGQVLVVGTLDNERNFHVLEGDEHGVLVQFWEYVRWCFGRNIAMAGWCLHHFDLPFLVKRSWHLGVPVPMEARVTQGRTYWNPLFVDVQKLWGFDAPGPQGSLDTVAKFLGVGEKTGNGKDFAGLWANEATRPEALAYLKNDLELTKRIKERMDFA